MSGGGSDRVNGRQVRPESSRLAGQGEYEYTVVDVTTAVALPLPAFLRDRRTPAALLRIRELRGFGYPQPPFAVLELSEKVVRTLSEAREPVKLRVFLLRRAPAIYLSRDGSFSPDKVSREKFFLTPRRNISAVGS
jgi:hypothetical protein